MMSARRDRQAISTYADPVCRLPAMTYGTMEFDMTEERRDALVAAGRAAMQAHLDARQDLH